jgi:hypothetical protein
MITMITCLIRLAFANTGSGVELAATVGIPTGVAVVPGAGVAVVSGAGVAVDFEPGVAVAPGAGVAVDFVPGESEAPGALVVGAPLPIEGGKLPVAEPAPQPDRIAAKPATANAEPTKRS